MKVRVCIFGHPFGLGISVLEPCRVTKLYPHVSFRLQCEMSTRDKAHDIRLVVDMIKDNADKPRRRLEAPPLIAAMSPRERDAV